MKLVFNFFILTLFICFNSYGCKLSPKFTYTVLSAPVSVVIKELGLIDQVRYLGSFHPFEEKVQIVDGGIFLRSKNLDLLKNSVVFYDESKALNREFKNKNLKVEKVSTRNLSAVDSSLYVINLLTPYLLSCATKVKNLKAYIKNVKDLISRYRFKSRYFFYLGEVSKGSKNNLIIANDGFVKDLRENKSFSTYPSDLSYVSWSSKLLKSYKDYISIGVTSANNKHILRLNKKFFNATYPGVLIPGLQQVNFLKFFIKNIKVLSR